MSLIYLIFTLLSLLQPSKQSNNLSTFTRCFKIELDGYQRSSGFFISDMEKICGIYKITSPKGRIYIGQALDIHFRWRVYRRLDCKNQFRLYNSFLKYGVENHVFEIIHKCKPKQLNKLEKHYVKLFDTFDTKHGLNLTDGGDKCVVSEETKRKLSEGRMGEKNPMFGKQVSEETRKKRSESMKGRKQTDEHIRKRAEAQKGRIFSDEHKRKLSEWQMGEKGYWFGKKMPKESNLKKSEAKKGNKYNLGRKYSEETKKKNSDAKKGEKNPMFGKHQSEEHKRKIAETKRKNREEKLKNKSL